MSIALTAIAKRFGTFPALRGVDLMIEPGEFLALLGPSGSGKTTLLRVIAGLEFPDAGTIAFDGQDVTNLRVAERGIGFVFQHYALFKHMTVAENVGFGLSVRRRSLRPGKTAIRARAQELLDLVQLGHLGDRYPAQLSGGQRQRVALARALAVDPTLLLLDEPFGALDAKVRKGLRQWLRAFHDRLGLTTVFVTHDQEEALEMADRVVVMNEGRIEQLGPPREIYDAPANAFVFDFVGESNRLPVRVTDGAAHYGDRRLDLPVEGAAPGAHQLFFRPHDAELVTGGGGIAVRIEAVRPREGHDRVEAVTLASGTPLEIEVPRGSAPEPGSEAGVHPHRGRLFAQGNGG